MYEMEFMRVLLPRGRVAHLVVNPDAIWAPSHNQGRFADVFACHIMPPEVLFLTRHKAPTNIPTCRKCEWTLNAASRRARRFNGSSPQV